VEVRIKNVGAIESATIRMDGLTVLTGENDTGKSTVLKAIYTIMEPTANLNRRIRSDIVDTLYSAMDEFEFRIMRGMDKPQDTVDIKTGTNIGIDKDEIKKLLSNPMDNNNLLRAARQLQSIQPRDNGYSKTLKIVEDYLSGESGETQFLKTYFEGIIRSEFSGQIVRFGSDEAYVKMCIDSKEFVLSVDNNGIIVNQWENVQPKASSVFYIDTPYVVDELGINLFNPHLSLRSADHRTKLTEQLKHMPENNLIDALLADEKMQTINGILGRVLKGHFTTKKNITEYVLDSGLVLNIRNLATGLKTFSIVKMLADRGLLGEGTVLAIDEPEVHLHPRWQNMFAELLVLMSKDLKVRTVITTHSPSFLLAVEAYSAKHRFKVDYYNAKRSDDGSTIQIDEVNDRLNEAYRHLAEPYLEMDDLLDGADLDADET
jgi:AAA15 family ATPase/GTPase